MAKGLERTAWEKETLVFPNRERADSFRREVGEKIRQEQGPQGLERRREQVGEVVAGEFAAAGEPVEIIKHPWEHSREEHDEAQMLVNVAFAQDLAAALKQARKSPHYPRNLDLFHDVLTGEMYDLIENSKLNRQPLAGWGLLAGAVIFGIVLAVAVIWMGEVWN